MRQLVSKVDRVYWDASVGLQSGLVLIGMRQLVSNVDRCLLGCVSWLGVHWDASIGLQSGQVFIWTGVYLEKYHLIRHLFYILIGGK